MEQDRPDYVDQDSGSPNGSPTSHDASMAALQPQPQSPSNTTLQPTPTRATTPQPTVLTLRDLADLPGQILPEETYRHLKNAGKEAVLALVSLMESINSSLHRSSTTSKGGKVRRQIDVE
jgi:hypothetical protein